MAKISVAMTTYNGSNYIIKQLDSLKNQSRKIDELIICDDCSPDNCGKICDEYRNCYDNVCVVHQENQGVSEARNQWITMRNSAAISYRTSSSDQR